MSRTDYKDQGFPTGSAVKNSPASAGDVGDTGLITGSGRSSGKGNDNPLQYPCLENTMGRGAWWAAVLLFYSHMSCPTLCDPMDCSTLGFPVLHHLSEFTQTLSTESVMLSNCLTCCCSLPFLPSVFPRFRIFSSESALCTRWPKYWNFNFSISPSNQY